MKILHEIIFLIGVVAVITFAAYFWSSRVDAGLPWVRATYPKAKHCYPRGEEPSYILYKLYYPTFESCHSTLATSTGE